MDAYQPDYLYWEALDMLRKLALVGLVLCVGRGSVVQLTVAILLSFMFFALQLKTWPCKSEALVQQLVLILFCVIIRCLITLTKRTLHHPSDKIDSDKS